MTAWLLLLSAIPIVTADDDVEHIAGSDDRCGGYTLYVALTALDVPLEDFDAFEQKLGAPPPGGYSLGRLAEAAEDLGLHILGVQTNLQNLARRPGRFACIAHLNGSHFVNVGQLTDHGVVIIDPPRQYVLPKDTFNSQWDGTALLLSTDPLLAEEAIPKPFEWCWLQWAVGGCLSLLVLWRLIGNRPEPATAQGVGNAT